MRYLLMGMLMLAATSVIASEDRVFSINGSVYQLFQDSTYSELTLDPSDPAGMINLYISSAHTVDNTCQLRMTLVNNTERSIRLLFKVFKGFTNRAYDNLWFYFGGASPSDAVDPGGTVAEDAIFEEGTCEDITAIETAVSGWGPAIDPTHYHVDGLSAADSAILIHYPDIGLLDIVPPQE